MKEKEKWYQFSGPWPYFPYYMITFVAGMLYGEFISQGEARPIWAGWCVMVVASQFLKFSEIPLAF